MSSKQPDLSVLICTYNRAEILASCLESLVRQSADPGCFEVIVVDNHSTDQTAELVRAYTKRHRHFHYVLETSKGLSYARNRAYREAHSSWLLYMDDDARADEQLVESAIALSVQYPYDMYGGIVYPWYKYGRPHWYRDTYAEQDRSSLKTVTLQKDLKAYAKGCLMLLRKALLDQHGDFAVELGMTGEKIAYGEETELQSRFRKAGATLAFAPQLKIHHLVPPYKMRLDWFFQSAYALGRDNVPAKQINASFFNMVLISFTAVIMLAVHLIIYSPRLVASSYHFENWAIDVFRKVTKRIGTVHTLLLEKERKRHDPNS